MAKINRSFISVKDLTRWLEMKNFECGNTEAYNDWLCNYFNDGNTITVGPDNEEFDYWDCWELI